MRFIQLLPFASAALAACNGHDELCGRKYSEVYYIGAHDSAFAGKDLTDDQYVSVADQLSLGVRFLEAQTHDLNGTIEMCHSYCWELDAGPLTDYLKSIQGWLASNPNEVVTLLLTNQDAIPVNEFDAAFDTAELKQYVYHLPGKLTKDQWPTLQDLINAGTRLVVFMDYHADQSAVDYINNEFDYFWETPYGVTDKNFPNCDVDRPSGGDPKLLMGIMNHMLNYKIGDIVFPDQTDAATTNSLQSITAQTGLCNSKWGVNPNVVLLDWVNIGDAAKASLVLNGLS